MSVHPQSEKASVLKPTRNVLGLKKTKGKQKLTCLTCYDYTTALILDRAGVDILLVGDSLAMTVLGHPDTLRVTVDEMLHHTKAVVRGTQSAFVVADMPFLSYQIDLAEGIRNAGRFLQEGGAKAVKLEGASPEILTLVHRLSEIGIPVMGHLGFTPQSVHQMGGFKVQGKSLDDAEQLIRGAKALERAGAFAIVLEMIPHELATAITKIVSIPIIGIGAGNGCDGQVLVIDDLLGRYSQISPRFVRRYMDGKELIQDAVERFCEDIQTGAFPSNDVEAFQFPENLRPQLDDLLSREESSTLSLIGC
jgi:3-methyl-2-oxobutanoate hydroxymethyltransferase